MDNAISITHNHDLAIMIEAYKNVGIFMPIIRDLAQGQVRDPYSLNKAFLLYGSQSCMAKDLREKMIY